MAAHRARVDAQNVASASEIGQAHFELHLESPGPEQRLIKELWAVRQPNHEHIRCLDDAIHLGEQLVDHGVAHAARVAHRRAALPCDRVHLIQDDYMQRRRVARRLPLRLRRGKEFTHLLLGFADELIEDLGAVDHLRGTPRSSEVIRGHPRPSEAIRGHPRSSEAIGGHPRSSEVIH